MILSFGLDQTCARSKEKEAGKLTRQGAGAETGARAGARSDLMKYQII